MMRDDTDIKAASEKLSPVEILDRQGRERAAARDPNAAAELWKQAAAILCEEAASVTLQLAKMLERAAIASLHGGQHQAAADLAEEAARRLQAATDAGAPLSPELAPRLTSIGQLFCAMRRWDAASSALTTSDRLLAASEDMAASRNHVQCLSVLATAHHFAGRHSEAITVFERAAARSAKLVAETCDSSDRLAGVQLANSFGRTLLQSDQPGEAARILGGAVADLDAMLAVSPEPASRNLLAATLNKLGHAHAAGGDHAAAAACLDRSVDVMRVLVEDEGQSGLADDLRQAISDRDRLRASQPPVHAAGARV